MNTRRINSRTVSLSHKTAQPHKSVVVLGAGKSLDNNKQKIKTYIDENNSLVISANYDFSKVIGRDMNFVYFSDVHRIVDNLPSFRGDIILSALAFCCVSQLNPVGRKARAVIDSVKTRTVYLVGRKNKEYAYAAKGVLDIDSKGRFDYYSLGIAGLGALLSSLVFCPDKILVAGLDEPTEQSYQYKSNFDGTKTYYGKKEKALKVVKFLTLSVLPTIQSRGVDIETFDDVVLHGITKQEHGIKVIG